jgi:hypothetical protein
VIIGAGTIRSDGSTAAPDPERYRPDGALRRPERSGAGAKLVINMVFGLNPQTAKQPAPPPDSAGSP